MFLRGGPYFFFFNLRGKSHLLASCQGRTGDGYLFVVAWNRVNCLSWGVCVEYITCRLTSPKGRSHESYIFAGALFFGVASVATATEIDLTKKTCQEFLQTSKDETGVIYYYLARWLFSRREQRANYRYEEFAADAKSLSEYCAANPTVSIAAAAEKVFGGK